MGAPIIVEGVLWGVIMALSTERMPLPEDTEARLARFTDLVAMAIANAQARDDLRRIADEQTALREVATRVAEGAAAAEVFGAVAAQVARVLGVPMIGIARYEPDGTSTVIGAWGSEQLVRRRGRYRVRAGDSHLGASPRVGLRTQTGKARVVVPIATPHELTEMLERAKSDGYAYPAINVTSSLTLNAAMRGLAEAGCDGFIQITPGGAEFAAGSIARNAALGARALAEWVHLVADRYPVLISLHTDHCPADRLDSFVRPLLAETARRRTRGATPLFGSHMFDGSALPLADNLAIARGLLDECTSLDVVLEVEVGAVGGEEDGIASETPSDQLYTTTDDLVAVADALGTGEQGRYLLAATFGNVHGYYRPGQVQLRPSILADGQAAIAARYGPHASFDYVFHGGSGSPLREIREAIAHGVVKMNVDTETQYAYTRSLADHIFMHYDGVLRVDGDPGDKRAYDPRAWGAVSESAMAQRVAQACTELGCEGRSLVR